VLLRLPFSLGTQSRWVSRQTLLPMDIDELRQKAGECQGRRQTAIGE
jgi:hypothetical protein